MLVLATLAAAVTVMSTRVDGVSMRPTFANGDRVLLRPFSGGDTPKRFDLVVGRFTDRGPTVIKRVIGLPGDGVRIETGGGGEPRVQVQPGGTGPWMLVTNPAWDGQWGTVPLACCRTDGNAGGQTGPQIVPAGSLFLLGDNPGASEDSRTFGWAPVRLLDGIVGWRLTARILPTGIHSQVQLRAIS